MHYNVEFWGRIRQGAFDPLGEGPALFGDMLQEKISDTKIFEVFLAKISNGRMLQLYESYFFFVHPYEEDRFEHPDSAFIACEFFDGAPHEGPINYDILKELVAISCIFHSLVVNTAFDPWHHIHHVNSQVERLRGLPRVRS